MSGLELVDDRVRAAVAAQLINKGLGETTRSAADLYVGYGVVDHTHTTVYRDNWGWGPGWGWRYYRWGVAWPVDTRREVGDVHRRNGGGLPGGCGDPPGRLGRPGGRRARSPGEQS